jgi:ABC-type branched-subunit amino acid transport system substrate-binding protein
MTAVGSLGGGRLGVGLATPLSGSLSRFGRDGAEALALWAEHAAKLPARWEGVELCVVDAAGRPADAVRELVDRGVDVLFGP